MPSLRRALSTPSVRVSPYPSLLASRSQRPHPHGHRRSSGSDLSTRKVLADIDWWRVADGQREKNEEEEGGEGEEEGDEGTGESTSVVDAPLVAAADHSENASVEVERPSTPDVGVRNFGLEYNSPQVIRLLLPTKTRSYPFFFFNILTYLSTWSQLPAPPPAVPRQSPLHRLSSLHQRYPALLPSNAYPLRTWVSRTPGQGSLSFRYAWRLSALSPLSQNTSPQKSATWTRIRSWPIP